ncbi:MAG: formylmethanofuran dehydrogenase [Pyrinomonadaceae bacterium]|nr:formylmethanofuran dehydrogenase [Pyrinomonadaceae bacterium]
MAILGCRLIEVEDPRGADRKKLIVWVEIDRCMTDAVSAATGVRLGRRSLKHADYGKVAATFFNVETERAVRIAAMDEARAFADKLFPAIENRKERQLCAYRELRDEELFKVEMVKVRYDEMDRPGSPRSRVTCIECGEGINDGREINREGHVLCRPCNNGGYYTRTADI